MKKSLFNPHQEPRPFGMKTRRPNAVTRFLMALFVIMLIPQGTWAADKVIYYKYDGTKFVEADADTYTLNPSSTTWSGGTIVITGTVNYDDRIEVTGDVDLVLCDQATLNAKRGIGVPVGATLTIYGQEKGTGELNARGYYYNVAQSANSFLYYGGAAIGGCHHGFNGSTAGTSYECGSVIIHGGIITADSSTSGTANDAAGIGGFGSAGPSELTVYGGKVTAKGGKYSAGIGGGGVGQAGGTVSIYGGEVIATGGDGDTGSGRASGYGVAMGIGGGSDAPVTANGTLTLGSGVIYYGDTSADPINQVADGTHFQYMKMDYTYGLKVAGTTVTASNASNIKSASTATASFYPATNTLKLNNLNTDNSIQTSMENLNILLEGSNTLGNSGGYIRYTGNGTGTLTFSASSGSTLKINNTISSPSAIDGFSTVNLNGVYLHTDNNPFKFDATNKQYVGMNGGLQSIEVTTTPYYMLWVGSVGTGFTQATDGALSDNMGNISQGSVIFTRDANNNTNTLTLNGAYIDGFIQSGLGDLTIDLKGNNTIAENGAYLTSNRKPISSDVSGALTFTTTDGTGSLKFLDSQYPAQPYSDPFDGFTVACDNDLAYNSTSSEIAVNYDLWVNGTQVNSANASNVFNKTRNNKATVSYANDTKTLTLNGESISVDASSGIKSGVDNLKVFLVGDNWIPAMNLNNPAFEGKNGTETITFQTDESNPGNFRGHADGNIFLNIKDYYDNNLTLFKSNNTGHTYLTFGISTPSWKGEGSENSPYIISDYDDLVALATFVNNDSATINMVFKLEFATGTLNCTNQAPFPSIGYSTYSGGYRIYSFDGIFKGNGSTIQGLTSPYGLFAFVRGSGVIENLTLDGCVVSGGDRESAAAGLVADMRGSKIENCIVQGCTISNGNNDGLTSVGGLVGYTLGSTISKCTVKNTTVTQGGALTFNAGAGGLVGRTDDGASISECTVENTQISANTTGSNEIYAGAIVGWTEKTPQLNKNYYDYQVTVTTQKGNDPAVTKSGNVQRGLGDGDDEFENVTYNLVDGAVLTGLQTITLTANTDGTIDCLEGYYRYVENTNSTNKTVTVYALPSTQSNQGTKIKATSPLQYDTPTITISDLKSGDKVNYSATAGTETTGANAGAVNATWEIEMPAENVTATIAYPIDFSNGNRAFAITNPVNATKVYDGSPISITEITTKPSATSDDNTKVTLDISKNDFTITGYNKMSSGAATPLGTTAPTDAGDYQVIISGNGSSSNGTATVNFTIEQATSSINAQDKEVTYNGTGQAYTGGSCDKGSYSVTYYPSETDRTNNTNGYTTPLPSNADKYYVRVTQTDPNYKPTFADATFTIKPKSIASAVITLVESSSAFNNTTQVPTIQSVYDGNVPLNLDVDYTVKSNTGGKDVGPYEVIIQGKGNYDAATTTNTTFNITVMNATPDVQVANTPAIVYDGNKKEPAVTVTVSGVQLTTADYTVVYSDNINAGINTAKATVTLKHNYSGSDVKNFTIDQREVELGWSNTTFTYDGDPHVPTAKVNNPAQKTDVCNVTVDGAQTNAGSYTATAARLSNNNYKLPTTATARTTTFKINPKSMTDNSIGVSVTGTYAYDDNAKTPTLTVTDGTKTLDINNDYSVIYQKKDDNGTFVNVNEVKDAGTYKAVVTGANNYQDDKSSNEFSVGKADINGVTVSIKGWNYGDPANSPSVTAGNPGNATVKYEYKQENAGDDTYTETVPTNAETYIVRATVPATPNYKEAQCTTKFIIAPCSLAVVTIEPIDEQTYKGSPITPVPTMYIMSGTNKVSLKEGTDFDCTSYANNTNAAEITATSAPTVTITCKGNFKGQQDVKFTIKPLTATLTWSDTEFTYDGNSHKPTAKVSNIISPDGCTVEVLGEQINASTTQYTATASRLSNNNYKLPDQVTETFVINPVDLSTSSAVLTIDPINDEVYTGNDITPTPNVYIKLGTSSTDTQLLVGTDFTYGYANNKDAADKNDSNAPTVTINGTGNYMGSALTKFTILDRVASINLGGRTFRTYYNASETNLVPDDIQAYIVTGVNGNEVTVQPVSYIPKQTPVLLEAKAGAKSVKNKADDFTTNKLAYATNDVAANGNQYLLYNGEFVRASGIISGKVYLNLGSNSPARTYVINTNNTTAIESVFDEEADGEEKWYDMQGRRINKPTKAGLYIKNGQKVVIKNK